MGEKRRKFPPSDEGHGVAAFACAQGVSSGRTAHGVLFGALLGPLGDVLAGGLLDAEALAPAVGAVSVCAPRPSRVA